jgi:hypothetical protein
MLHLPAAIASSVLINEITFWMSWTIVANWPVWRVLEMLVIAEEKAFDSDEALGMQTLFITSVDSYPMNALLFCVASAIEPRVKFPSAPILIV